MAIKVIPVHQKGKYINGDKQYEIEVIKSTTEEIYNFRRDTLLVCSVYTKYLSKAVGVKKAGDFNREYFGDITIFNDFQKILFSAKDKKAIDSATRFMADSEGENILNVIERRGETWYHKQVVQDDNIVEEVFQDSGTYGGAEVVVELNLIKKGRGIKVKKDKSIDYNILSEEEKRIDPNSINSIEMISRVKDLSWLDGKNYRILKTMEEFDEYLEKLKETKEAVGIDTETTGLRINRFPVGHPKRDYCVGICLSIEDDEGVYIPIKQRFVQNLPEDEVIDKLRPFICQTGMYKKDLVTHGGGFDTKVFYTYGIRLNIVNDTYILGYMINNSHFKKSNSLKDVVKQRFGVDMVELKDVFNKQKGRKYDIDFSYMPENAIEAYAPADSDFTRLLCKRLRKELPREMEQLYYVEIELLKRLAITEYYGIKLDIELIIKTLKEEETKLKEKEKEIYEFVGREFKIGSPKVVEKILYDELGCPEVTVRTKSGARSTGKLALEILANEKTADGKVKFPLVKLLKEYRDIDKYINGFLRKMLNENIDGYIFPSFNQTGTDTGRISSSNPNIQQTPASGREAFIPDSEDYYMVIVDYSQIEYRILASMAKQMDVVKSFEDPETDYHTSMYARMFAKSDDEVTSEERKQGKTMNFGVVYGMKERSFAIKLYGDSDDVSVANAAEMIDKYFDAVPQIRDYMTRVKLKAKQDGYSLTKFNRRRYYPDIKSSDERLVQLNMNRAANTAIQGTGADIIKIGHVRTDKRLEEEKLDARILISMHDELVLMVNKSINPWYMIKLLRECMELNIEGFAPLYIGSNVGNSWAAGKRDDLEIPTKLTDIMFEKYGFRDAEGFEDPVKEVETSIKQFIFNRIREEILRKGIKEIEEAKKLAKIYKMAKDYFGRENIDEVIRCAIEGEAFNFDEFTKIEIYSELSEFDKKIIGVDSDSDDIDEEDDVEFDELAMQRYHIKDKDRLIMKDKYIIDASKAFLSDTRILVYDGKCRIDLTGVKKSAIDELKEFLEKNNAEAGYQVSFKIRNKTVRTNYHLSRVDRIRLFDILDSHSKKKFLVGNTEDCKDERNEVG